MNTKKTTIAIGLTALLIISVVATLYVLLNQTPNPIRVACVGDSLTQSTAYPYDLMNKLGTEDYDLRNYGAGATTVLLNSETPYMNNIMFQNTLDFKPNIIIIMIGTNDAQPGLEPYNTSFIADYTTLIRAFQALSTNPKIWIVLPPPIFSNQTGRIDAEYYKQTILPDIQTVANQNNLPTIDVYTALLNYPQYFPDGIHPTNPAAAEIIATTVYNAITQNKTDN